LPAERHRQLLVDQLRANGSVRSGPVEAALRAVPRHVFVPDVTLSAAYANDVVVAKRDSASVPISSASQPSMVARMLEQLHVTPGMRILEIGAGTGYNAALLAHLAGGGGHVTTVDVDADLVARASQALRAAGYPDVFVVAGDGALGYPDGAPYDRVIATAGAWDLPLAWLDQLTPDGRLVVPLRLRGMVTRSIAFERDASGGDRWRSVSSEMCSFMPLRGGVADDPASSIPLTPDGAVMLLVQQDQDADPAMLAGALHGSRADTPAAVWTGVTFGFSSRESAEWLFLWLACTLPNAVSRMTARQEAVDSGIVAQMAAGSWGTMATFDAGSLAYLTGRPAPGDRREIGVIGHGPRGARLARQVAAQVRAWHRGYRTATARFAIQPVTGQGPVTSQFTFRTPHTWLAVDWQLACIPGGFIPLRDPETRFQYPGGAYPAALGESLVPCSASLRRARARR
jgi:protein-L-isoaspartate(D-aspartate) O-methyltransferase